MRRRVLVTDGGERAALATVRALGRAGFAVDVCAPRTPSLAGSSRYADCDTGVPDPLQDPEAYRTAVAQIVRDRAPAVLLPISEQSLRALLPARFETQGIAVPFPPADTFAAISDKQVVLDAARALGLAVPEQVVVRAAAPPPVVAAIPPFPVVIKPSRSVAARARGATKLGVTYADNVAELERRLAAIPPEGYPVLVQRRIVGPGIGIFLLRWNGRIHATFAHRRLREKPPAGGVSVYRESVPLEPALVERATALLERFDWRGVAMVEFKTDATTGRPYLMEVNGRLWGSLQLALDAGIDFPTLLVRAALGEPLPPAPRYRVGVRTRWWWGDVDQLLARLRHSRRALSLPPDAQGRGRAVAAFLRFRFADHNEILWWSDLRPFVRETIDWVLRR